MRVGGLLRARFALGVLLGIVSAATLALPPALTDQTDTLENHLGPAFYGEVRGGVRVSSAGSAIYEIPIAVPPGTAGMTPSLSLLYNSNLENGLVGLGWFLRGTTSKVTRCGKTFVQDGAAHRVNYTTTDRFCLDGQRLVLASGTYGGNGAEYRKEIDDFSRIRSYGTAGTGPAYFVEERKDGRVLSYGNTADARIEAQGKSEAAHWMLNRVEDRFGNYYTLSYYEHNGTGVYYPIRIDYTGHAGQSVAPYASVQFTYENRSDNPTQYQSGVLSRPHPKRLSHIKTYVGATLVRDTTLTYAEVGPALQSRLVQIASCDANGNCQEPVQFEWLSNGTAGFTASSMSVPYDTTLTPINIDTYYPYPRWHDLNGDGRPDYVYIDDANRTTHHVRLSTPTGYQAATWTTHIQSSKSFLYWGDVNGDGLVDLVAENPVANVKVSLSSSSGYSNQTWTGHTQHSTTVYKAKTYNVVSFYTKLADMDADALPDLVAFERFQLSASSYLYDVYFHKNTGSGFAAEAKWAGGVDEPVLRDMNGDGRADLVEQTTTVRINQGAGFLSGVTWTGAVTALSHVDANGDGLPDQFNTYDQYYFNSGASTPGYVSSGYSAQSPYADFNGDRLADYYYTTFMNPYGRASAYYADGTGGYTNRQIHDWEYYGALFRQMVDLNGDGQMDYSVAAHTQGQYSNYHYETGTAWNYVSNNRPLNVLTTITHGLGETVTITYAPLTDSAVYTKGSGAVFPVQDVQDDRHVVKQVSRSDGIGGQFVSQYRYAGLKREVGGRGDLGFASITAVNDDQDVTAITTYRQDFPFIGLTDTDETRQTSTNRLLARTTRQYHQDSGTAAGTVFPHLDETVGYRYDPLDGRLLATSTKSSQCDAYGNLVTETVLLDDAETSTTWQTVTTNTFTNNTSSWRIGQLDQRLVKHYRNGVTSSTDDLSTAFTYATGTGALVGVTREPGKGAPYELTSTYTLDAFGNRLAETVTGPGIATRSTTATYTANGRFPATLSNALGHTSSVSFDTRFGVKTSATDPNGLTTSWVLDGFGRVTQENRPDGSDTVFEFHRDTSGTNGTAKAYVETYATGTTAVRVFSDMLGREVRKRTKGFDGAFVQVDTQYDGRGRSYRTSEAYFAGDPIVWNTRAFDAFNRVVGFTAADGTQSTTTAYDGFTVTVTDADARQTTQVANALGQVIEATDADGNTSTFQYNALGQRTGATHGAGTGAENSVDYAWDRLGRQLSEHDPDRGLYSFTYDALGQMTSLTNPVLAAASQSQTMSYDLLGRLTSRTEPEGTASWIYDTGTGLTVGRLVSESVGGFSRSVEYGAAGYGKPTAITTTIDGQSYTLSQSYDAAGRLETLTYPASQAYPSGLEVGYLYNVRGYLEQVTGPGNALYYQVAEQDARGRLLQDWLGDDSLNDYAYAANSNRLTGLSSAIGATTLQQFAYTYDAVGNITSRSDVQQSLSESFTYDGLDRVTEAQVGTNAPTGMSYDLLGNLLSKSDLGSYAYGENGAGLHALTTLTTITNQTVTYTYDANGNMTGGGGRSLGWTTYNQLSQVSKNGITYTFQSGTDRQRYKKVRTAGTTQTTHYVGDVFERITESGLTTYRHYLKVNGMAVAIVVDQTVGTDVTKYLHRDHLGSITTITDSTGSVLERLSYDSHGKRRSATTWQATSIAANEIRGYTGHEHLDDVGLIHMNGRVYDPSLGRMLSPDPVTQSPEDAQNYNRYAYVMNNPMRFVDPSGFATLSSMEDIQVGGGWVDGMIVTGKAPSSSFGTIEMTASSSFGFEHSFSLIPINQIDWAGILAYIEAAVAAQGGEATPEQRLAIDVLRANAGLPPLLSSSPTDSDAGGEGVVGDVLNMPDPSACVIAGGGCSFSNAQMGAWDKQLVGNAIKAFGAAFGKLDTDLEQAYFDRWWNGDGSDLNLDQATFIELVALGYDPNKLSSVVLSSGAPGYSVPLNTYSSSKYDYAIGTGTLFLDLSKNPVGFFDNYNFNAGARASFMAEAVTRGVGMLGNVYGGQDYRIYYGLQGSQMY